MFFDNIMKKSVFTILISIFSLCSFAQAYRTQPHSDDVHTIQVNIGGNWQTLPVLDLALQEQVQINFDILGDDSWRSLKYRIINCDAYWNKTNLSEIEYLNGFNNQSIDDYAQSVNTIIDYTNYNLIIPNDRQQLKLSGNYAVEVYDEDFPDQVLLTACFSVLESKIKIEAGFTSNTDIDTNKENQQVFFTINTNNLNIRDPFSDLKIVVRQNNRTDNQRVGIKPTYVQANKLIYEHNRDLIFQAGNEYRRFESISERFNGLNILSTESGNMSSKAYLKPSVPRSEKRYIFDKDQNGKYLIRNAEASDPYTEADYFETTFTLDMNTSLTEPVYLNGAFTYDLFSDKYKMTYDDLVNQYTNTILLKQGAYNYLYLVKEGDKYSTGPIEGNYFETQNEYTIYVYYYQQGKFYDQLVGFLSF